MSALAMSQASRRAFLRHATALSGMGVAAPLSLNLAAIGQAAAQAQASDYRALVCLFMHGGNDAFNMVLPTDPDNWAHYTNQRNPAARLPGDSTSSIALLQPGAPINAQAAPGTPERLGGVLPLTISNRGPNAGRPFALHPQLMQLHSIQQSGRLAVLSNVGPLTQPLSKRQFESAAPRPTKLFSHNDQQSTWQSFQPEGASHGWGGRMGDLLMSGNGQGSAAELSRRVLTCMSLGGGSLWLTGQQVRGFQSGWTGLNTLADGQSALGDARVQQAVLKMMTAPTPSNFFAAEHQATTGRSAATGALLGGVLSNLSSLQGNDTPWASPGVWNPWEDPLMYYISPIDLQPRFNSLAVQLQMVARLIDTNRRGQLGLKRQMFMVSLGGFDLHDRANIEHADRMAQLDHAMAYFDRVLGSMPAGDMRQQVTTFTASEFGRSLTNNSDGTDHGWGAHHLIMGGAVQGHQVYGQAPQLITADAQGHFDSPDLIHNGVLLPSTSVDQYACTLGQWMGVSHADLLDILPNLQHFDRSTHNLGFMQG
jgi:uncharacterized protein (DUF1501 family)